MTGHAATFALWSVMLAWLSCGQDWALVIY